VEDLLDEAPEVASRLYLLEDCSSPVVVPGVVDYTDDADAAFARFAEAGAHVVCSIEPLAAWPGHIAAALRA
jgi:nicotinamidase-related amidase